MSGATGLFVEVATADVPLSTRRLALRCLRRSPDARGVALRWFAWIAGSDPAPIRRALAGLVPGGLTFLADRGLAGRVTLDDPGTVWLSAHLAADEVAGVVAHELEHVRLLRLAGPPRDAAEHAAHELGARIAERGVERMRGFERGKAISDLQRRSPPAHPRACLRTTADVRGGETRGPGAAPLRLVWRGIHCPAAGRQDVLRPLPPGAQTQPASRHKRSEP